MTRAIIWKEFREQGLIGLTLIVFGAGILVAAATLADAPVQGASPADVVRFLGAGLLATLMLAVTAGTVCGGALFAAEREAGTIGFLESLPASRWQIWRAKLAAGALLAVAQIGLVLLVAVLLGLIETPGWAFAIAVFAMLAFSWGVYGSTHAQTTLGSVGVALPSSAGAFILFFIPMWLLFPNPRTNMLQPEGGLIFLSLMFTTPLLGSAIRFTRSDRARTADDSTPIRLPLTANDVQPASAPLAASCDRRPARIGIKALLWLSCKQLAKPGLIIAGFAAVLGLGMLPDNVHPILLWPGLALTAGVLAGVTMFMDEQSSGSSRFWGERRLPIGRLWCVKLVIHGTFALLLAAILLLPCAIRAESDGMQVIRGGPLLSFTLRSLLFESSHLGSQGWKFLVLPLAYGFVAGHLSGLMFKKAVVAAGVAGVVGGSLAAFWLPSLFSGGTKNWQLWMPPLIALATAGLLLRAWSSERLPTRRPLTTLAIGLVGVLLVLGAGLSWRILEVPDDPKSEDDVAYIATLPPLEAVDSGRQFRAAAERFVRVAQTVPPFPRQPPRGSLDERIANVPFLGWSASDPEAADWIEKVYALDVAAPEGDDRWFILAGAASRDPVDGIFEHPLRTGTTASLQTQANGRRMGYVLLTHGLMAQSNGNPAAFVEDLRSALALGRTFRNGSLTVPLGYGNDVSRAAYSAADRWLTAYDGPPQLLRTALDILVRDDAAPPFDPRPHLLAERYLMRDLAKAPSQFLPAQLTPPGRDREQYAPLVDLIGVAWNVPWERERTRRLMGLGYERGEADAKARSLIRGRPGSTLFVTRKQTPQEMAANDRQLRLHRRALLLMVAIRLHQLEKGVVPASLDDLVRAGCLAAIPLDPYDDQPFRYRISAGEVLNPPPVALIPIGTKLAPGQEPRLIAAGQPVVWSVGSDRSDDGGRMVPSRPGILRAGADYVYLPPVAAEKK